MNDKIREMQAFDWPMIAIIYQQGMDTNIATFQTECPSYEEWNRSHIKECRLVIMEDSEVVGFAALTPVSSRCVYAGVAEVSIYIHSDKKGKGLATKLLEALIDESEKQGLWTLQSGIMQDNQASIRLHEKCGFEWLVIAKKSDEISSEIGEILF